MAVKYQVLKICLPRIPYLAKLFDSKIKETKICPDKPKFRESITNRPTLQELLKGILQAKMKCY